MPALVRRCIPLDCRTGLSVHTARPPPQARRPGGAQYPTALRLSIGLHPAQGTQSTHRCQPVGSFPLLQGFWCMARRLHPSCRSILHAIPTSSLRPAGALYDLCGRCLSQFQICVCVSGLVRLLSFSKFSLRQSASTVTKSLSSPAGASCQSTKKTRTLAAVCSYIEQPRQTCTETQQRF